MFESQPSKWAHSHYELFTEIFDCFSILFLGIKQICVCMCAYFCACVCVSLYVLQKTRGNRVIWVIFHKLTQPINETLKLTLLMERSRQSKIYL